MSNPLSPINADNSFVTPEIKSGRISIDQYNKEIEEAMAEAIAGNYMTQEELEKEPLSCKVQAGNTAPEKTIREKSLNFLIRQAQDLNLGYEL